MSVTLQVYWIVPWPRSHCNYFFSLKNTREGFSALLSKQKALNGLKEFILACRLTSMRNDFTNRQIKRTLTCTYSYFKCTSDPDNCLISKQCTNHGIHIYLKLDIYLYLMYLAGQSESKFIMWSTKSLFLIGILIQIAATQDRQCFFNGCLFAVS